MNREQFFQDFEDWEEFEELEAFVNYEHRQVRIRAPKRYIRDFQNPFERFRDVEFKKRFRFSKDSVLQGLLPKVEVHLRKDSRRGLPIGPAMQLLVALRFYATSSFQIVCGDLEFISQSTVSKIIYRVSLLLAHLLPVVIKMPTTLEAIAENRRLFRDIGAYGHIPGLPGIDGALDCSHIKLTSTHFQRFHECFRNRKGYFSLNVQATVGPRLEFLDLVPEWPGVEHDSRIFQNSRLYMRYARRELTGRLVGDAGYPCQRFLLTPVSNPRTAAEEKYNFIQSRTRRPVERAFGVWKRRFPCLSRGLSNKLTCATAIVGACGVLHNLSLQLDAAMPENEGFEVDEEEIPTAAPAVQPMKVFAVRNALIEQLYS